MAKVKVHIHTDCRFFAGSEFMLVNFFSSKTLKMAVDYSFSYRTSKAYEEGLQKHLSKNLPEDSRGLGLIDFNEVAGRFSFFGGKLLFLFLCLLGLKFFIFLYNFLLMRQNLKELRPEVLHVNNGGYPGAISCHSAVWAARTLGIKNIIYMVNNIAVPYRSFHRLQDWWIERPMRSWVKYYVNGSYNAQSFLKKVIPLKGERFKRIPNAPIERPVTVKAEEYRARRGIEPGQLFIGVVALLEERKGHHVFLEGLRDYVSDYEGVQNIKVIFQGHGELERKLQTMIDDYQLSDWVKIMPNEPEVMNFINAVDILALPSISHEDFPTVVIEAMSLARPVVASRLAGTPEQIDDPHTGLLLPPGEAPAWTEFFKNIDHYLWDEMGEKGRGLFNGQFAREVVLGQYERMYLSLKETAHD